MRLIPILLTVLMLLPACGRKGDLIIPGTVLPSAATGLDADPRGDTVILGWNAPDRNTNGGPLTDLAGFVVMRAPLPEETGDCPCRFERVGYADMELPGKAAVAGGRVAWPDSAPGLVPGGRYAYKVIPVNADGFSGQGSAELKVRLLALPAVPAGLTATPGNCGAVLMWEPPASDATGAAMRDLTGFDVYRSLDMEKFPSRPVNAAPISGGTFEDSGLANGQTYYYKVSAVRGTEPPYTEGDAAGPVPATPADISPPAVPAGLRAVPGEGFVLMSWDPATDADLAGYVVYRKSVGEPDAKDIARTSPGWITYEDMEVKSGGEYAYSVSAFDDAEPPNESARSEEYEVKVP